MNAYDEKQAAELLRQIKEPPKIDEGARRRLEAMLPKVETAEGEPEARSVNPAAVLEKLRSNLVSARDAETWEWENEVIPRLKECGFESRYWKRIPTWEKPAQKGVFDLCQRECRNLGATIALVGLRGTGKTTIAAQMAISRAKDAGRRPWDRIPAYRKLSDIIARYKPLYADFGSTQTDQLLAGRDAFCRGSLVFIDEIHECEDSKLKGRILTDIIDRRYSAQKDTILISNQTADDFNSSISDSIQSRMREHGRIIPCNWESWRQ